MWKSKDSYELHLFWVLQCTLAVCLTTTKNLKFVKLLKIEKYSTGIKQELRK